MRACFFDVDGTLSAPAYMMDGKLNIGMTDEAWFNYLEEHGEDTYEYCKAVPKVKEYALRRKAEGAKMFVLTTSSGETEDRAKKKFIARCYDGIFDEFVSVAHDADKVEVIKAFAKENDIALGMCEMVEDTYSILLKTVTEGIVSTHVANIYAED